MAQIFAPTENNNLGNAQQEHDLPTINVDIQEVHIETIHSRDISATTESDAFLPLYNAIDGLENHENCNKKACSSCSKPRRVTNPSSFMKGQHISMAGQHLRKYIRFKKTLKRVYDHHAIVKEIIRKKGTIIQMDIIHFSKTDIDGKFIVYEETIKIDLRVKEMYIVDYMFPKYDPDEIVARAVSILSRNDEFSQYNFVTKNCEHFATWCVVGEGVSFQVQDLRQKIADGIFEYFGSGSLIATVLFRLCYYSADVIATALSKVVPGLVLLGTAAIYLIYCIVMTLLHVKDYRKGQMCWSCLKGKLLDLWLSFAVFGLTSIISFLIFTFAIPLTVSGVGIPLAILLVLLSVALHMAVPSLLKALGSPFSGDRKKVENLGQINIGDVIAWRRYGVEHLGIVTEVKAKNEMQTHGYVRLVHYASSYIFGTRTIKEEDLEVNLDKKNMYLVDCKHLLTFPANDVVSRARSRIGESKWDLFSNRSDNLTYWAKVNQLEDECFGDISNEETPLANTNSEEENQLEDECFDDISNEETPLANTNASLFIGEKEIHRIEDLNIGDVVKSGVIGKFNDTGILASMRYLNGQDDRKIEIVVYTYTFLRRVVRKNYVVDLNKNRLCVRIYNQAQCQSMSKRVENGRDLEGEKGSWWTTEAFIEHCIELRSQ